jgi:hypothetical protein
LPEPAPHTDTLAHLIAATLGLSGQEREPLRSVVDQLTGSPALLVLDNL